jgi:hypothetical protein
VHLQLKIPMRMANILSNGLTNQGLSMKIYP